jgi:hypothetical protein
MYPCMTKKAQFLSWHNPLNKILYTPTILVLGTFIGIGEETNVNYKNCKIQNCTLNYTLIDSKFGLQVGKKTGFLCPPINVIEKCFFWNIIHGSNQRKKFKKITKTIDRNAVWNFHYYRQKFSLTFLVWIFQNFTTVWKSPYCKILRFLYIREKKKLFGVNTFCKLWRQKCTKRLKMEKCLLEPWHNRNYVLHFRFWPIKLFMSLFPTV